MGAAANDKPVDELQAELDEANRLLGDSAFYIRRMARILEGYNHPSRIQLRALGFVKEKLLKHERIIRPMNEGGVA